MTFSTDLTDADRALLRVVAGHMIPACAERGLPGADDAAVIGAIAGNLARDIAGLHAALAQIRSLAAGGFEGAPAAEQATLLAGWREASPARAQLLEMLIARAYYQDPRVRRGIGLPDRPPYPHGYAVAAGDLSLLDPVRARGPIYRDPKG